MSPGTRLGQIVQKGIDEHFNGEIESYCKRHDTKPEELEVYITPGGKDVLMLSLQHRDPRLILPKRVFKFTVRLDSA